MLSQITRILEELIGADPGDLPPDLDLFENGLLDSFAIVQLVVELEEKLGVRLEIETLSRADLATPTLIAKLAETAR
jgi:D-alanine--poly(phosphoribitol) ligase subunit 2